jgi:nitrate reductase gamma subunit
MSNYLNYFLFSLYPYIAISVFVFGCLIRYKFFPYSWKSGSSQLLSKRGMVLGNNLFHIGIILIFLGHLVGLLTPEGLYIHFVSVAHKQLLAMIAGGVFGAICFIGLTILICRRLFNPRIRQTSSFSDILILLLLYVQLILGMISIYFSAQHLDGSSMVLLADWAQHIVSFQGGASTFVVPVAIIFKIHIVLGLTIFLIFPFTRLVHMFSAPVQYVFRTGYQIVRPFKVR